MWVWVVQLFQSRVREIVRKWERKNKYNKLCVCVNVKDIDRLANEYALDLASLANENTMNVAASFLIHLHRCSFAQKQVSSTACLLVNIEAALFRLISIHFIVIKGWRLILLLLLQFKFTVLKNNKRKKMLIHTFMSQSVKLIIIIIMKVKYASFMFE